MKRLNKSEAVRWIIIIGGTAAALAIFCALFCMFLVIVRDLDGETPDTERAEIVIDLPSSGVYGMDYEEFFGVPEDIGVGECTDNARTADGNARGVLDIGCVYAEPDYILAVPLSEAFQVYLHGLCEDAGVPYTLAVAVIEQESNYDPAAVSPTNDWGLMQINEVCHEWLEAELGIDDWLDPYQNAKAGVWILGGYYRQYGYASGALVAYNQGQASAEAMFSAGVYETDYSRRVIGIRWRLEHGGAE